MPRLVLALCCALVAAGCSAGAAAPTTTATTIPGVADAGDPPARRFDVDVTRGIRVAGAATADLYRPIAAGPWPLVVLVPGGAWRDADPASTAALAGDLARRGAVVLNTGYRLGHDVSFADVACAVAVAQAGAAGWDADGGRPVLAGHSAGAHVAAIVALAGTPPAGDCEAAGPGRPAAFVGIAGPYEVERFAPVPELRSFFGGSPEAVPEAWAAGDPFSHVAGNPGVDVALVHGRTDLVVLPVLSLRFAEALRSAGREVNVYLLPGANHRDVLEPAEDAGATAAVIFAVAG